MPSRRQTTDDRRRTTEGREQKGESTAPRSALGTAHSPGGFRVLTVDIGSSSVRANLYTSDGQQLQEFETKVEYAPKLTNDGGVEIDPQSLLHDVVQAIDGTIERAGDEAGSVRAVGFCSLVANVMGIGRDGQPTTPIYTWADTRCAAEAEELRHTLNGEAVRERTGCPIHASYLPARLLWLERTNPKAVAATVKWISLGEWLGLNFLGETWQTLSVASWGGLLNRRTLAWDGELLRFLKLDEDKLPRLVDYDKPLRGLKGEYEQRWPALRDVPWFPCVGDGVTSNLGAGCSGPQDVAVQVGTSGAMRAIVPGDPESVPEGLWCYRVDRENSLLGGALSEGGNFTAWLRDTLRYDSFEAMEKEASLMPPDSHGLTVLPFVAGERSPGWRGDARATFSGISLNTKPAHLLRAAEEAIAYRFGLIFAALKPALPPVRSIVASGGALLNAQGWMEILADVVDCTVTASGEEQASSRGTALLVLKALGALPSFDALPARLGQSFEPDPTRREIYHRAMQRQQELYKAMFGSA